MTITTIRDLLLALGSAHSVSLDIPFAGDWHRVRVDAADIRRIVSRHSLSCTPADVGMFGSVFADLINGHLYVYGQPAGKEPDA